MTPARPGRPDDTAAPDDRVHQIVFRWAGNVGHRGAGIAAVAHSCPEPEARALADRLGPVLRVMGGEQRPSVVRHILPGGRVLLVRRTPGSDAQGRDSTVCHALLGPANYLVPLYCVSLGAAPWAAPGWADQVTGEIEPVSRDRLKALATDMRDRMWENVPLVRRPLVCLVAQFLRTPGARLSALAGELDESLTEAYARAREHRTVPPPEELPEPALLVLWGLWCVFGPSLDREREAASWQFATFDTRDDQPYRVVFVPAWRVSPTEDGRLRRIDLLDPGTDRAAELATMLVDHYLDRRSDVPYRRLLDTDPNSADPEHRRCHALLREVWPGRYGGAQVTDTGSVHVADPAQVRSPAPSPAPAPSSAPSVPAQGRAQDLVPPCRQRPQPRPDVRESPTPPAWQAPPPTRPGPLRRSGSDSRSSKRRRPARSRVRRRSRRRRGNRRRAPGRRRVPCRRRAPGRNRGGPLPPYRQVPSPTMGTQGRRTLPPRIRPRRVRPLSSSHGRAWTRPPPDVRQGPEPVSRRSPDRERSPTG